MFQALQFVAVLASAIFTVLSSELSAELSAALHNVNYEYFEGKFKRRYEIHPTRTVVRTSDFNFEGSFSEHAAYAYSANATINYTSSVNQVKPGARLNDRRNDNPSSLSWTNIFFLRTIVPENVTGISKMDNSGCQVYIFTIEEHWQYKSQDSIEASVKLPLHPYNIPATLKTAVHNSIMPRLNKYICARVNQVLRTAPPNPQKKNSPFQLSVGTNHAVDRALRRFREDIIKHHAEKIDLGNVTLYFQINIVDGFFHGGLVASGGTFENLSTIERTGNATAKIDANGYNITSTYTFAEARVHFDSYKVEIKGVPYIGNMSVMLKDLEIQVACSAVQHFHLCNNSLSLQVTRTGSLHNHYSEMNYTGPFLRHIWRVTDTRWTADLKNVLEFGLGKNLLRYGATNYSDNIFGPCVSDSSEE